MRRPKYTISWIIIGLTFPLLAVLTVNQFNWLQELQKRDRDRITRSMLTAVDKFSLKLQEEILYPAMITRMRPTNLPEIDAMFAERFFFWENYAPNSALVRNVYLVDGLTGKARQWDNEHFVPTSANPAVTTWNKLLREGQLPAKFQETDTDLYMSEPAFTFDNEPYFFIYDLDKLFILKSLIPTIAKSSLDTTDLFAYRIVDTRDNEVLYTSLSRYLDSTFDNPDLELPVMTNDRTNRPPQETDSFARKPPRLPIGCFSPEDGRNGLLNRAQNFQIPHSPEEQQMQNQPQFIAMKHGIPSDFLASVRIQIVNRDGSLADLSSRATWQNALISFGILAILLLGMIMLAEASRRARELAISQQEFIATITHELKTPLAVISSAAQNLSDGLVRDQAKTRQYGEMINREASRLTISVEHFLLYSNTSTMTRMKPVLCEVAELVQTALKFTEEDRAKYEFITDVVLPQEPVYILGDRIALESVFQNLAQNVLRHAADGKYIGIFVAVEEKQSGKKFIIIKIRDKGPGISPWEQKTIFEPFVRGRRAIEKQIPGNGIGLNLVKRIVNVHGGTITLESKLGMGSAFTIAFPENRGDTDVYQDSDDRR